MAEKFLRVTMPDGSQWDVPARLIADSRARYYAANDPDTTYQEEYDYTINDAYEIEDWAANNMNWSDVAEHAVKAEDPEDVDYQEGWVNGDKRIVER